MDPMGPYFRKVGGAVVVVGSKVRTASRTRLVTSVRYTRFGG